RLAVVQRPLLASRPRESLPRPISRRFLRHKCYRRLGDSLQNCPHYIMCQIYRRDFIQYSSVFQLVMTKKESRRSSCPERRPSAAAPGSASTQVIKINGEHDKCRDPLLKYVGVRLREIPGHALDVKIFHRRVLAVTADEVAGSSPALDLALDLVLEPTQQI